MEISCFTIAYRNDEYVFTGIYEGMRLCQVYKIKKALARGERLKIET